MINGSIASVSKSVRHEWQRYGSQGRFGETPKPAREGRVLPMVSVVGQVLRLRRVWVAHPQQAHRREYLHQAL